MTPLNVGWAMYYLPILVIPLQGSDRSTTQFSCGTPTAPCSWADDKAGFWAVQCYSFRGRCTEPDVWITCPGFGMLLSKFKMSTFGSQRSFARWKFSGEPWVTQITLPREFAYTQLDDSPLTSFPPYSPLKAPQRGVFCPCDGKTTQTCQKSLVHCTSCGYLFKNIKHKICHLDHWQVYSFVLSIVV